MSKKYVLTLDFGTQSVRALLFNRSGNTIAGVKKSYPSPYFSSNPGWFEQDADVYYNTMCDAIQDLKNQDENAFKEIAIVSLTCFRDTALLLDKDYNPIRPCILWLDQRVARASHSFPPLQNILFTLSGMKDTLVVQQSKTMANWYRQYEPENWKKTEKYVNISTYFNYRFCGVLGDTVSNMTGHYPIDFKHRRWLKKHQIKRCIFDIEDEKLCSIFAPEEIMGKITLKASYETGIPEGTPFVSAGSDKSCESLGCGTLDESVASISYGTASTIEITSKKYVEPETFLPAYASSIKGYYNSEVQIYRGFWMLNWFAEQFCEKEIDYCKENNISLIPYLLDKIKDIEPGSNGLVLSPYWGPSLKRPNARGVIVGFSDTHTKYHVLKAIIEGIAYALKDAMEVMEKKFHKKVKALSISGGGSRSDIVCQITADIFGLPIYKVQTEETSSLGAAIVGFLALKQFDNPTQAIEKMVRTEKTYFPNVENHKKYDQYFYNTYLKIYPKIRKINHELRKINKFDF